MHFCCRELKSYLSNSYNVAEILVFLVFDKNRMLFHVLDVKCQLVSNIFIYKDVEIFISACIGSIGFFLFEHLYCLLDYVISFFFLNHIS